MLLLLLLFLSCTLPQESTNFAFFFTEKSIEIPPAEKNRHFPGDNIMVIFQDSKNTYWFGSWEDGLYRYEGKSLTHFTTKNGLPSNRVEEIKEDHLGNLYVNTSQGLCRLDGNRFSAIPESTILYSQWKLQKGDLWFKSPKNGFVYRYDGRELFNLKVPKIDVGEEYIKRHPSVLNPYAIYCNYTDSRGNIWFGTAALGTFRYNGTTFDWITEEDVTEMHDGPSNGVRSIIEDKEGCFWFNANFKYNVSDIRVHTVHKSKSPAFYDRIQSVGSLDGKKHSDVDEYLSVTKDNAGNLWFATYTKGVYKYDGKAVTHYPVQVDGRNIHLFYLYRDNAGTLWLGTHENGIHRFNGQSFIPFKG
jgi:ligand-binding sensor domain-containing protein